MIIICFILGLMLIALGVVAEIAWLGFLFGSVVGVVLVLIFAPVLFLAPFLFLATPGIAMLGGCNSK
ncbi:MAG: hypothetical protein QG567_1938 [Campylobacterota bacterium]|nr:hypothetical protein [Campylobacterota bacterium]